jgi:diguanylate cyclase (GGDEF)-like protein/PAS domain S-box-containing protein
LCAIFQWHPIPMWLHDKITQTFIEANEQLLKDLGYNRDEFMGMHVGDILSTGDATPLLLNVETDSPPQPFPALTHVRRKDGRLLRANLMIESLEYKGHDAVMVTLSFPHEETFQHRTLEARLRINEFAHTCTLDELLQKTLDEAEALTESAIGFFHFIDDDQVTIHLQNWSTNTLKNMCTAEGKYSHYDIDKAGVWVDCVRERRPIIYNDYASLTNKRGLPPGHAPLLCILTVPIIRGEKIVAILGVGNKAGPYDETDAKAVQLLADLAWDITVVRRTEEALRISEYRYRSVTDQASDGIFIANSEGQYIDVNAAGCQMLGYTREELLQHSIQTLLVADPSISSRFNELKEGKTIITERELLHKNGKKIPVEISAKMLDDGRFLGIVRDISERKQVEDRIRYMAFVMSKISNAVISTDINLRVTHWNEAAEQLYGYSEQEALGRLIDDVCGTEFSEHQQAEFQGVLLKEKKWQGELKQRHRSGRVIWISASVTLLEDAHGNFLGGVTINHDITQRKQAEDDLIRAKNAIEEINTVLQRAFEREQIASRTDSLTGVFNRGYFFELLGYEFSASVRYDRALSLIMFDIDRFKAINDECGHLVGDEVLKQTAKIVGGQLRETDVFARYGGDEFVVLLPNSDSQEAFFVFQRVLAALKESPVHSDNRSISVTLSAGIASLEKTMKTPSHFVHVADQALYSSKQAGRNRVSISSHGDQREP